MREDFDDNDDNEKETFVFDMQSSIENVKHYFAQIKQKFPTYEERLSQKKMIFGILKGYESNQNVVVEAPTGTGKSLGYLIPFLSAWEQADEETRPKLVVATNTIALQEQLMHKDIPMLQEVLPHLDFKAALVKGKSNYICRLKYKDLTEGTSKKQGAFQSIEELNEFNNLKKEIAPKDILIQGDRSKIKMQSSSSLWDKLCVDGDTCTKKKCPFYNECFFYRAKSEQRSADILVANHALFFADLAARMETNFEVDDLVLPGYEYLVFDEAHHLEDVASDFLGKEVSRLRMKRLCTDATHKLRTDSIVEQLDTNMELKLELLGQIQLLDSYIDVFCNEIIAFMEKDNKREIKEVSKRLNEADKGFISLSDFSTYCKNIVDLFYKISSEFDFTEEDSLVIDNFMNRFERLRADISFIVEQEDQNYVYWLEAPNRENRQFFLKMLSAPVDVSDVLRDNLFSRHEYTIVLTSATLGTDNVEYLNNRLGVSNALSLMFHSPFNYEEQSCVFVPKVTVNPKSEAYEHYLKEEIEKLIKASKGRALVLFTANSLLTKMADHFRPIIEELGYMFLKQGEMPKQDLIQNFREDIHSVLFATASFWEGIDVPGEALSLVVITKLPFEVPDRPIVEARVENLVRQGKNAFIEYQVPLAVIKFKQGFGRLIRKVTDKGVVAVLDPRIVQMHYGKLFLKSLPQVPLKRDYKDIEELLK